MRGGRALVGVVCGLSLLLGGSCKAKPPKPGDECPTDTDWICADDKTRLVCNGGKYALEHCSSCVKTSRRGCGGRSSFESYGGCIAGGIGPEGAACTGETWDCTGDGKTLVTCDSGAYRHVPCRGPAGCHRTPTAIECDHAFAEVGDVCHVEKGASCTRDGGAMLRCVGGKYAIASRCGGAKRCASMPENKIFCDTSTATVGETCESGAGCSADGHDMLACKDGRMAVTRRCRGKDPRCVVSGTDVNCADPGHGEIGDPCQADTVACTADGKQFLECQGGRFVFRTRCRTCTIDGDRVTCKT